jgi:hypothetical protein
MVYVQVAELEELAAQLQPSLGENLVAEVGNDLPLALDFSARRHGYLAYRAMAEGRMTPVCV